MFFFFEKLVQEFQHCNLWKKLIVNTFFFHAKLRCLFEKKTFCSVHPKYRRAVFLRINSHSFLRSLFSLQSSFPALDTHFIFCSLVHPSLVHYIHTHTYILYTYLHGLATRTLDVYNNVYKLITSNSCSRTKLTFYTLFL